MSAAVLPRAAVPREQTWDAESVFADAAAWQAEYRAVLERLPDLSAFAGRLGQSPARLLDWLETLSQVRRRVAKLSFYATMCSEVDAEDETARALLGQRTGLLAAFSAAQAFQHPELLALGPDTLRDWMQSEPRLALYAQWFDDLFRQQPHIRSAEVEALLGALTDPFETVRGTFGELTNSDMVFAPARAAAGPEYAVTQSSIGTLLQSPQQALRQSAWEHYAAGYLAHQHTLASNYAARVKQNVFKARARRHPTALAAALAPDNIPVEVFYNLIHTFQANLATWHRYWDVKRRAMKLPQFQPWDVWAPILDTEPVVPFEQAVDWIAAGMAPLGPEYVTPMVRGCLEQRWVDRALNAGKRQGAFSEGTYDTAPFIMMSYNDTLKSLSTLAHELGHSMHSYFARRTQPEIYSEYTPFVAETASNFNQAMARAYLLQHQTDTAFKIAVIEEGMTNFHRYFFIMPTLARFELAVHTRIEEGKSVTADSLNSIMNDFLTEGYGSTMTWDRERSGITWAQYQHPYVAYYTFQYSTGISAAHSLADGVLKGEPDAAGRYLRFLSAGNALYPLDALKLAGVDMRSPEPIEKTFAVLAGLVDLLETLTTPA